MTAIIAMAVTIGIAVVAIVSEGIIKPTQQLPAALLLMRQSKTDRHKKTGSVFELCRFLKFGGGGGN
ncbi:hypothetical protein [Methylobacter svalbardensis]|uniref:hypothetical protein n=1 Tax=Methylobacter svalbardensis TaxID=3080016 RepID=UPI0030EE4341